jgi:transcriptional regulator with XRE-family HTH domain
MGGRIKAAREELKLSQSQLAEALGFQSATAVSLIENGERGITSVLLQRLGKTLHRSTSYFLGEPERIVDVKVALRADKDLSDGDKDAILRFIQLAKEKPDAKR